MKRLAMVLSACLLSAGWAWAGPLVPKDVSAGAKWFGHVNCEAIRSLKLVQDLKDKCPEHARCQAKVQELAQKLGMNPLEDVLGATLYSDCYGSQLGVALVYVKKVDRERLVNCLHARHPDYTSRDYGHRLLYSWTVTHHGKKQELTGAFASDTLVVIGAGVEQVQAALDVIDGKKPALAGNAPLIQGIPPAALVASCAIDVPDAFRKTTHCPVLHNCKAASVVWSENGGQITGRYELAAESPETAKNFQAIVQGFLALGQLHFSNLPVVKKVLDGLKVEAAGAVFQATFSASTADIEAAVRAAVEHRQLCPMCHKPHGPQEKCEPAKK